MDTDKYYNCSLIDKKPFHFLDEEEPSVLSAEDHDKAEAERIAANARRELGFQEDSTGTPRGGGRTNSEENSNQVNITKNIKVLTNLHIPPAPHIKDMDFTAISKLPNMISLI